MRFIGRFFIYVSSYLMALVYMDFGRPDAPVFGKGGGGKVAAIFDPIGAALGLHEAVGISDGDDDKDVKDPQAPAAAAATEAADKAAKLKEEEEKKRRALEAETSLTSPLGLQDSVTTINRPSLLG